MNVSNIIEKFNPKTFQNDLEGIIIEQLKYVTSILGEGAFGIVYSQDIGQIARYQVKNENIFLKVAIKKIKSIGKTSFLYYDKNSIAEGIESFISKNNMNDFKKVKYSNFFVYSSDKHPNGEFIILSLLSKLWYNGENPHVNFMIAPLSIDDNYLMDGFLIERCGLSNSITFDVKNIPFGMNSFKNIHTRLENVSELLVYSFSVCDNSFNVKDDIIGVFNLVDLIDELLLSYLFSYQHIEQKSNVTLIDLHSNNLMIKFIDEFAYVGANKLENYDSISYELNGEKYYVKMDKFLLKFGDVGLSIAKKNNFIVIGDTIENMEFRKIYADRMSYYIEFLLNLKDLLPYNLFKKTICEKIISEHFGNFALLSGIEFDQIKPYELIKKYFQKFKNNKYKKSFPVKN